MKIGKRILLNRFFPRKPVSRILILINIRSGTEAIDFTASVICKNVSDFLLCHRFRSFPKLNRFLLFLHQKNNKVGAFCNCPLNNKDCLDFGFKRPRKRISRLLFHSCSFSLSLVYNKSSPLFVLRRILG